MYQIDVVEKFNEVDLGNNQLYIESKGKIMQTAIFFIVVAVAVLSLLLVFAFRYRRGSYNTLVLKESNQKLDGLLWILTS
jgi:heme/copper-type cytochrome/quinol oxidase subunit 2